MAIVATAVVVSLLVAASRVYLDHHLATDVIAGRALGAASLALVLTARRMYLTSRLRHDEGEGTAARARRCVGEERALCRFAIRGSRLAR